MGEFERFHPAVLLLIFASVLAVAMFLWNPVLQALLLAGAVLYAACLRGWRATLRSLAAYLPFFLLITLTNPLFSNDGVTPVFYIGETAVTLEAFAYGASIGLMLLCVLLWFQCYSDVMTSDKFLFLFGRALPRISLVLTLVLRFIPLFRRQMHRFSRAQQAMGLYDAGSRRGRVRSRLRVFSALMTWTLENGMETSAAMTARGYGLKGRSHFSLFRFTARDGVLAGVAVLLLIAVCIGAANGGAVFYFYPQITLPPVGVFSILTYTGCGLLALLPVLIEIEERIKWHILQSNI